MVQTAKQIDALYERFALEAARPGRNLRVLREVQREINQRCSDLSIEAHDTRRAAERQMMEIEAREARG